jgi:hypothetical protein
MKRFIGLCGAALFITWSALASDPASESRVCVLTYEREAHPITKAVKKVFRGHPEVALQVEALPIDFLKCIRSGATEILFVAHAVEYAGSDHIDLGYFRRLEGIERDQEIAQASTQIESAIAQFEKLNLEKIKARTQNPYPPKNANERTWEEVQAYRMTRVREILKAYPKEKPYYVLRPILNKVFELARQDLRKEASEKGNVRLKKIRMMNCLPEQVQDRYPALMDLIHENKIDLDLAPTSPFFSWLKGKPVTSPDLDWIRKSLP